MSSILIVEDETSVRQLLGQILEVKGYRCTLAGDAQEARQLLEKNTFNLVVSDINMPGESGLDLMRYVLLTFPDTAGIMATAVDDPIVAESALDLGVYDYIVKPIERNAVLISVANALRRLELEVSNRKYRQHLENMVAERTASLQKSMEKLQTALDGTIKTVAHTIDIRDPYTAGHQRRVSDLAVVIAKEMSLSEEVVRGIEMGGIIHDLGKISIPAEILSKPGKLTDIEFSLIKTHPQVGFDILKDIEFPWPIAHMVLQHHERMDGSGYPNGLVGEDILVESRILSVADVVEAMASHRPYRPSLGIDAALDEISRNKGGRYDEEVADACIRVLLDKKICF